jgi:7-cyano-7-deazaguanine reductase
MTSHELPLGRAVDYPRYYDPGLLFPFARTVGRTALSLAPDAPLPFTGIDRWHAYELSWLDARGKPVADVATFSVPADSPNLVESKSLKLYLNSFNASRFERPEDVRARIAADLSHSAGRAVRGALRIAADGGRRRQRDRPGCAADRHRRLRPAESDPPDRRRRDGRTVAAFGAAEIQLPRHRPTGLGGSAHRLPRARASIRRACCVTSSVFRDHAEFHEQCVERIFIDVLARCRAERLSVEARYTRRGGLDINPWRGTPGLSPPPAVRALRQ